MSTAVLLPGGVVVADHAPAARGTPTLRLLEVGDATVVLHGPPDAVAAAADALDDATAAGNDPSDPDVLRATLSRLCAEHTRSVVAASDLADAVRRGRLLRAATTGPAPHGVAYVSEWGDVEHRDAPWTLLGTAEHPVRVLLQAYRSLPDPLLAAYCALRDLDGLGIPGSPGRPLLHGTDATAQGLEARRAALHQRMAEAAA